MPMSQEAIEALSDAYGDGEPLPPPETMAAHVRALIESHRTLAREASQLAEVRYRLALAAGRVDSAGDWSGDPDELVTEIVAQREVARRAVRDADARLEWQREIHTATDNQVLHLRGALEGIGLLASDANASGDTATIDLLRNIRARATKAARRDP